MNFFLLLNKLVEHVEENMSNKKKYVVIWCNVFFLLLHLNKLIQYSQIQITNGVLTWVIVPQEQSFSTGEE